MRLQNAPLLKPFSKASVFISVFGRFSVNDVKKGAHKWLLIKQLLTDNKKKAKLKRLGTGISIGFKITVERWFKTATVRTAYIFVY